MFFSKRSVRNLVGSLKDVKGKVIATCLERVIKRLHAHIEYDSPHPSIKFSGIFKLDNDPQVSTFTSKNVLFAGTKLCSSWIIGVTLYNGQNTKIMSRLTHYMSINSRINKKPTTVSKYLNMISIFGLIIAIIQTTLSLTVSQARNQNFQDVIKEYFNIGSL